MYDLLRQLLINRIRGKIVCRGKETFYFIFSALEVGSIVDSTTELKEHSVSQVSANIFC